MNRRPLSRVTQEHIDAYERDGVVCLRQMFDSDWIERLTAAWRRVQAQLMAHGADNLLPQAFLEADPLLKGEMEASMSAAAVKDKVAANAVMQGSKYMAHWDPDFRAFALESPAGEIVGRVLQARQVRFYWDQIFQKRPGGNMDTYWHTDQATWPTLGEHLPSLWLPLTPISEDQSLEYIAGSHRDRTEFWGRSWNASNLVEAGQRPPERPEFIDYEQRRGEPGVVFLKWAMEPGDVMMFHPRIYHGGGPNRNPDRERLALSTRWFGDDITWNPRPGDVNVPGMPHDRMVRGAHPDDDDLFPIVWRRDEPADRVGEADGYQGQGR